MSAATIGISNALDGAFRKACSDAGIRLAPDASITAMVTDFGQLGVTCSVEQGLLVLSQGSTPLHTGLSLRTFANKPENTKHFVTEGQHPAQWSREKKVAYLRDHSADEYARLCRQPVLDPGVRTLSLDMTREQYAGLTRAEKLQFIAEFGSLGVSKVMARKAK